MSLLILFDGAPGPPVSPINVTDINIISKRLVRITFDDEVVVDDSYNDPTNYAISVVNGSGPVEIVGVLPTNQNASLDVILITQPMTETTKYAISFTQLFSRSGVSFSLIGNFIARETKTDSILRSIPQHYDKRPISNLSAILTAISISDDLIGGSRKDNIDFT